MFSKVRPNQWVAVRLPSDNIKVEQMIPNTTINLGKFGSFKANQIIGRPFWITWEILGKSENRPEQELRAVKASELHADTLLEEAESDILGDATGGTDFDEYGLPTTDKSNANTFDDPTNQKLTLDEIEQLKSDGESTPAELIARLMASHSALDQKTAFSLAKYTLRKQRKYMKRFTILPLDVATVVDWMMNERDVMKIMEIRNEALGLMCSWANVHASSTSDSSDDLHPPQGRYLVVDDTGGLIVAALAEGMGILHHETIDQRSKPSVATSKEGNSEDEQEVPEETSETANGYRSTRREHGPLSKSNTIHLLHANAQPNLSLLRYFNFDPNATPALSDPAPPHPLHTHLKTLSWLQLLDPMADSSYQEPPVKAAEELREMKSNARSTYYRKRRRWERCRTIVDETRAGGFNGLVIASHTNAISMLHHLVPLLAGGAQIVIYNPNVEPLLEVFDAYSAARRTAFINLDDDQRAEQLGGSRFPADPTLTLGFTLHTSRAKKWQVLPGRTHPLMMGRGGAEGYVAVATRVLPFKGKIQARGKQARRPKRGADANGDVIMLNNATSGEEKQHHNSSSEGEEEPDNKKVKHGDGWDANSVPHSNGVDTTDNSVA